MRQFKLTLSINLTEVKDFNPTETAAELLQADETEPVDPVERDENNIAHFIKFAKNAMTSIAARPAVADQPQIPPSHISVVRYFDVPAESLSKVTEVIGRFEELGCEVGMATNVPPPMQRYPYVIG